MKKNSRPSGPYDQLPLEFPPRLIPITTLTPQRKHQQYHTRAQGERNRLPESTRTRIFEYDDWQCRYCGEPADEIDHIIPWAYGGGDEDENLVAACRICNGIANDKVFDDFNAKRTHILEERESRKNRARIARDAKCVCVVCGNPIYTSERDATRFLCTSCNQADLSFTSR